MVLAYQVVGVVVEHLVALAYQEVAAVVAEHLVVLERLEEVVVEVMVPVQAVATGRDTEVGLGTGLVVGMGAAVAAVAAKEEVVVEAPE